jgi:hypothetical protein
LGWSLYYNAGTEILSKMIDPFGNNDLLKILQIHARERII